MFHAILTFFSIADYVDYEKKVLNSDSKQFHQYQKNKTITFHLIEHKKTITM